MRPPCKVRKMGWGCDEISSQLWKLISESWNDLREVEAVIGTKRVSTCVLPVVVLFIVSVLSLCIGHGLLTGHEFRVRRFLLHPVMTVFVAWQAQVIASENPFLYLHVSKGI
jgi:hypothetical protein